MTDKELVKMLRICGSGSYKNDCEGSPAKYDGCGKPFIQAADRLEALLTLNEALNERDEASKELAQALKRKNSALERNVQRLKAQAPKWVSVEEALPKYNKDVLCYRPNMAMKIVVSSYDGYYGEDDLEWHVGWARYGYDPKGNCIVTHWMPLPEPPSTEGVE